MAAPERVVPRALEAGRTDFGPEEADGLVLLAPKLRIPGRRRELVSRARLLRQLTAGPPKLTLIEAGAGWGKTTVLTEWSARAGPQRPFAWVSLDCNDNEPAGFWSYVVQALRGIDPAVGATSTRVLRTPGTPPAEALPFLVNELSALRRPVILVLDDYHSITSPEIQAGMAFLLDHLPESLRLVMATRSIPPLPVARSRARGELLEIRSQDLAFTAEEAAALLNDVLQIGVQPEDVARLHRRTEGWPAGLYLAALSMRGNRDPHEFTEAFAGDDRHITDYLSAEVLDRQPPDLRAFMLRTSVLDELCGSLCDAVTGGRGSAAVLEDLERANLFLISLDTRRRWYRYHHLFAELLHHELERQEPELVPSLHRRAAGWYARESSIPAAVRHATLAGDLDRATELIATHVEASDDRVRLETVAGWLDDMPPGLEARLTRPRPAPDGRRRRDGTRPESLTGRELAVLRLLPGELSLREIGGRLFLSLNTVKTHTRGIYRKLEVATRAEAVARARESGLL
jgi:LuxR family maltose regulon positive regulatory protein